MDERYEEMNQGELETFKKLIMIQLQRIEEAETLDEAKKINDELIDAIKLEK